MDREMRIYLSKIPTGQLPVEFLKEIVWIVGLALLNIFSVEKRDPTICCNRRLKFNGRL